MGLLSFCTFFLTGAYAIQFLPRLPADVWLWIGIAATVLCLLRKSSRPVGALLLGFVLIWLSARQGLEQKLDPSLVGINIDETFQVIDFVQHYQSSVRLVVAPVTVGLLPSKIRLSWYDAADLPRIGECWDFTVRLRRPRGFSNPVSFDYEGWLFRQSIGATGYIRDGAQTQECVLRTGLTRIRRHLVDRIGALLPDGDATAVLLAVTVGARHQIDNEQWRRYAVTGTSHLMAISGLHIGLAAGGAFFLSWMLLALCQRSGNIRDQAAIFALLIASLYGIVSGFAIPAQRALLMLTLVLLATLSRRLMNPTRVLVLVCIVITVADPLTILAPGFQLSFAAVAILLWLAKLHREAAANSAIRDRLRGAVAELIPMQIALLMGLLPLTAVLFGRVSWLAPLVNLLVLPVFNLVTVPTSLLGLVLGGPLAAVGDGLLWAAWYSVFWVLELIELAARIPFSELRVANLHGIALLSTILTIIWVVLPASWPGRKLAWIAALAAVIHVAPRPAADCVEIHALDVGQGLATVVLTKSHTLVFDTGPSFRSGSDTGALVLVPFLRGKGIADVDVVVVSHGDNDHVGGVRSLIAEIQVSKVLSGESLAPLSVSPASQSLCETGQRWNWDGVDFEILHPGPQQVRAGNNASCVLEIRVGERVALLTGDIELAAEQQLVREQRLPDAELVFVPHHGSRTSSHAEFIARLRPGIAVVSAGFDNQWGFPKDDVVRRWQHIGAEVVNTAHTGAQSYRMCVGRPLQRVAEQRRDHRRVWHDE